MRFLVRATIPVEAGNELVRNPNFGERLQGVFEDIRPEAVYFAAQDGQRAIYLLVGVEDGQRLPAICEPLWLAFQADVEFIPVMTQEEMARAAPSIEQAAKKY